MKTTMRRVACQAWFVMGSNCLLLGVSFMCLVTSTLADGCFIFRWNKGKDINEPAQKAILLHDQRREDLILQVKYEGPAEDFGWLIPVPGQPEVRKGSMQPFYELSRLTQESFHEGRGSRTMGMAKSRGEPRDVKIIEVKTVGAYEVTILSSTSPSALTDWLSANRFSFPKEKQDVLDEYIKKRWFFVVARVNPEGNGFVVKSSVAPRPTISSSTRKKLASGELHPIVISFPSEKCVFPLAISSVNGGPSEISLYVLSADPLVSPVVYDRKLKVARSEGDKLSNGRESAKKRREDSQAEIFRDSPLAMRLRKEDPNDPPPSAVMDARTLGVPGSEFFDDPQEDSYDRRLRPLKSMPLEGNADALKACRHDLPRLKTKNWWLTKVMETFAPEEMVDLEFESAIPFLAALLPGEDGEVAAHCLTQYGGRAAATVLKALTDPDTLVRRRSLPAVAEINDPRFVEPLINLLGSDDPLTKVRACNALGSNWDPRLEKPLWRLLYDPELGVARIAQYCLRQHRDSLDLDSEMLRGVLSENGPAAFVALEILQTRGEITDDQLKGLLSSTNLPVVSIAFNRLRDKVQVDDLAPLVTNSIPVVRLMALGALTRIADKPAVERIVSLLHDPNEVIRWRVRSALRRLTGQALGADPDAYEKWWAENKAGYARSRAQSRPS
jgi:hypothetical protein